MAEEQPFAAIGVLASITVAITSGCSTGWSPNSL